MHVNMYIDRQASLKMYGDHHYRDLNYDWRIQTAIVVILNTSKDCGQYLSMYKVLLLWQIVYSEIKVDLKKVPRKSFNSDCYGLDTLEILNHTVVLLCHLVARYKWSFNTEYFKLLGGEMS